MDKPTTSGHDTRVAKAKAYVDQQLATMKEHGSAPHLSRQEYDTLVKKVAATMTV